MSGVFGPDRTDADYVLFPTREQAIQQSFDDEEAAWFAAHPDPLSDTRIDDLNGTLEDTGIIGFLSTDQMHAFDRQSTWTEIDRENAQRAALGLPYRPRDTCGRPDDG
jgi:hypothetical protein